MPMLRRTRLMLPIAFLLATVVAALIALLVLVQLAPALLHQATTQSGGSAVSWPPTGQAAFSVSGSDDLTTSTGGAEPVPIASVTKMMTALVSLEQAPLDNGDGFTTVVTRDDVHDTAARRARDESVVKMGAGDIITERQALLGLLLPSAGNMANLLATRVAATEDAFVQLMNDRARSLGMHDTRYVDVSGYDPGSVSTARDQTVLARTVMDNPTFAWLVRQQQAELPTAGVVVSTDHLLGHRDYIGIKTGSTTPAGGCFVFAVNRAIDGQQRLIVGAVLAQRGSDLTGAAFTATERLVDSINR